MWHVLSMVVMLALVCIGLLAGAGLLHALPRMGGSGKSLSQGMCRAPGLDIAVTYFTVLPLFVGPIAAGWSGLLGAIGGQVAAVLIWTQLHERANPQASEGPRIFKVLNAKVGRWRNHAALWVTAIVTPMFWIVRVAEVFLYPLLSWLVGLPRYRHAEWVNVSRQKFEGLVGHDLIWCLYCDWMTGVWSLGSEMLRNVESFWCPIRFASDKKCERCRLDFPDVDGGWVSAEGNMQEVVDVIDRMHDGHHGWFGHPTRLTVEGQSIAGDEPSRQASDEA